MPAAFDPNQHWSMDFVADPLAEGRVFRTLNVVDDFMRECLAIEVDTSLGGERVVRVLDRICQERGRPALLLMDNGPEFTGRALDGWAYQHGVKLHFIQPASPSRMPTSRASTGASEMSASTSTGSRAWPMLRLKSISGATITTA